eukprot:5633740-Pyramimonas_sp.AAC.1
MQARSAGRFYASGWSGPATAIKMVYSAWASGWQFPGRRTAMPPWGCTTIHGLSRVSPRRDQTDCNAARSSMDV